MKISCCVFDLDGTLLTSENLISDTDKKTLRSLSEKGVKIIIATGRSDLQIREYVHSLGVADPVITCNGGQIINITTGEVLHRSFLRAEDAKRIIDTCDKDGIDYLFYTPEYVYHAYSSERVKFFMAYNETAEEKFKVPIRKASEYPNTHEFSDIIKILIHDDTARIPEFEAIFNSENSLTLVTSGHNLIDVMASGNSKGRAICVLAEKLGIPVCEIAAFGDSLNDEEMLRTAGFSVAMGNALDEIKDICDFVTKTNDEGGITHAIKHIFDM